MNVPNRGGLTSAKVTRRLKGYDEVKSLYHRAFPKNERFSHWLLLLMAKRDGFDYRAYYDDGVFCGFSYVVANDADAFVLYLAVNDKVRSKGYGTAILKEIMGCYEGKQISLNVEPPDKGSDNLEQRVRRMGFYEKNGFTPTGYTIENGGEVYWVLSSSMKFDPNRFQDVVARLSFGIVRSKIESTSKSM